MRSLQLAIESLLPQIYTATTKSESALLSSAPGIALSKTHTNKCSLKHILNPFLNRSLKCSQYSFQPSTITGLDAWKVNGIRECACSKGEIVSFRLLHTLYSSLSILASLILIKACVFKTFVILNYISQWL